jgi:hypothetical protein
LGHCEYVLKNDRYKHLAELPSKIDQYCPLHPQLAEFIKRWIDEYIELFGPIKRFHIGADEAFDLGKCPRCSEFAKKHSLSELYVQYVEMIAGHLIKQDIQPIIWADMVLKHPEDINRLSHKIIFADWGYNIYHGSGKVWVWSREQLCTAEQLDSETLKVFGKFLFPDGDEPGREPVTFYTADFLKSHGFQTITCSSSSSYGDNIFAPRTYLHMKNIYDSVQKGFSEGLAGSVLTSWTVRLFPWELQKACIGLASFAAKNQSADIEEYQRIFLENQFGTTDNSFFKACGLLSKTCLFSCALTLGFYKDTKPVPADHVEKTMEKLFKENRLQAELADCQKRLKEYEQGLSFLNDFMGIVEKGYEHIAVWQLAAKNLINRAKSSICLLKAAISEHNIKNIGADKQEILSVLNGLYELKKETKKLYEPIIKPMRLNLVIHWIYDCIENALLKESKKG